MKNILKIDASVRTLDMPESNHRSLSRALSQHFCDRLTASDNEIQFIHRDVGLMPPAFINQDWIAAVFRPEQQRSEAQRALLALSDQLIEEVTRADLILISSPMYNYGMPACLKAWFDQVVRINKTFDFDLQRGDFPLAPTLSGKTLVLLTSCGEFGFERGGIREGMNHLGPNIRTLSKYLGVEQFHEIRIEYQEFGDERHQRSIEHAYASVDRLAVKLMEEQPEALA